MRSVIGRAELTVPLPPAWDRAGFVGAPRDAAVQRLGEEIAALGATPTVGVDQMLDEFARFVGAGSDPLMTAWLHLVDEDDEHLGANLVVVRNSVSGELGTWSETFPDAVGLELAGRPALKIRSESEVSGGPFARPAVLVTWRYVLPLDDESVLLFTFTSLNAAVAEVLDEYFDRIMAAVTIETQLYA